MSEPLLRVEHLKKYFKSPRGMANAVEDVSFTLEAGKTLGVVGGAGPSSACRSPPPAVCFLTGRTSAS